MFTSLAEFKYYQTFRIPVESRDDVMFNVEIEDEQGKFQFASKVKLLDVSISGMGFASIEKIPVGKVLRCSIQFKRFRHEFDCTVVRANKMKQLGDEWMCFGAELDKEDYPAMKRFIEQYIYSLPPERLRESLVKLALTERYTTAEEGFEMFSLLLSLFKDITQFGNKEKFVESMLEEITRILNAQRASIFLINTETNELEAVAALGIDKSLLKFDYRKGMAGSVFTTGVSLNIDTKQEKVKFSEEIDKVTGYETKSIICCPITNREDKIIGVIEVLNKRNEDRFTAEDEKTMKVLALICSSVFHHYNPISERSLIRRFSTPYDREFALIGRSQPTSEIRKMIVKLKDLDCPVWFKGEEGTGKKLLAKIMHVEGKRGLSLYHVVNCKGVDDKSLEEELFTPGKSVLENCQGGTVVFHHIEYMPHHIQQHLYSVLQERRIANSHITLDVRLFFTTSLENDFDNTKAIFYPPLYQFMGTTEVHLQPLRKRKQDIDDLITYFMKKECKKQGYLLKELAPQIKEQFMNYPWPKNATELERAIERLVLYNPKAHIINDLGPEGAKVFDLEKVNSCGLDEIPFADNPKLPLKDRVALVEREMIFAEIKRHHGNKSKAAIAMGMSREALRKKLLQSDEILGLLNGEEQTEADKKVA
jgi:two-component system response regulator HydG